MELMRSMLQITRQLGDAAREVERAVADDVLHCDEARRIMRGLARLCETAMSMMNGLDQIKEARHG